MSNIVNVNKYNFTQEVLQSDKPVLVDFWAQWCGPCKMIGPILEEIANERKDIKIVKIDVDENQEIAAKYNIRSIPTMYIIKNGAIEATKMGAGSKTALVSWLESHV